MALEAPELLLVSCPLTGSSLPPSSWWGTGRTTSRCFLAGPLGAPHAIGLVFPFPASRLCGTLQWGPLKGGFCSLMDAWSTSYCGPQLLPRAGSGYAVEVAPV